MEEGEAVGEDGALEVFCSQRRSRLQEIHEMTS